LELVSSRHMGLMILSAHTALEGYIRETSWTAWWFSPPNTVHTNTRHKFVYFNYQLNAQFLYSITIYMLHYNPRHVSSSTMLIFRRSNRIITASGIVTVCKQLYSTPIESGVLYSCLQRVTIPDAVIIQFDLLKMGMVLLGTCRGL
jgi:hypothetical protein